MADKKRNSRSLMERNQIPEPQIAESIKSAICANDPIIKSANDIIKLNIKELVGISEKTMNRYINQMCYEYIKLDYIPDEENSKYDIIRDYSKSTIGAIQLKRAKNNIVFDSTNMTVENKNALCFDVVKTCPHKAEFIAGLIREFFIDSVFAVFPHFDAVLIVFKNENGKNEFQKIIKEVQRS